MQRKNIYFLLLSVVAVFGFVNLASANWSEPTSVPPAGNVAAPINVGILDQEKAGKITAGSFCLRINSTTVHCLGDLNNDFPWIQTGSEINNTNSGNVNIGAFVTGFNTKKLNVNGGVKATEFCIGTTCLNNQDIDFVDGLPKSCPIGEIIKWNGSWACAKDETQSAISGAVKGSGTAGKYAIWTATDTIDNGLLSEVTDNGIKKIVLGGEKITKWSDIVGGSLKCDNGTAPVSVGGVLTCPGSSLCVDGDVLTWYKPTPTIAGVWKCLPGGTSPISNIWSQLSDKTIINNNYKSGPGGPKASVFIDNGSLGGALDFSKQLNIFGGVSTNELCLGSHALVPGAPIEGKCISSWSQIGPAGGDVVAGSSRLNNFLTKWTNATTKTIDKSRFYDDGTYICIGAPDLTKSNCITKWSDTSSGVSSIIPGDNIAVTSTVAGGKGNVTVSYKPDGPNNLTCPVNQILKWNGTAWACGLDDDNVLSLSCQLAGQVLKWNIARTDWECAPGNTGPAGGDVLVGTAKTVSYLTKWESNSNKKITDSKFYETSGKLCTGTGAATDVCFGNGAPGADGINGIPGADGTVLKCSITGWVPKWDGNSFVCAQDNTTGGGTIATGIPNKIAMYDSTGKISNSAILSETGGGSNTTNTYTYSKSSDLLKLNSNPDGTLPAGITAVSGGLIMAPRCPCDRNLTADCPNVVNGRTGSGMAYCFDNYNSFPFYLYRRSSTPSTDILGTLGNIPRCACDRDPSQADCSGYFQPTADIGLKCYDSWTAGHWFGFRPHTTHYDEYERITGSGSGIASFYANKYFENAISHTTVTPVKLSINDGTADVNKILASSDKLGTASWKTPGQLGLSLGTNLWADGGNWIYNTNPGTVVIGGNIIPSSSKLYVNGTLPYTGHFVNTNNGGGTGQVVAVKGNADASPYGVGGDFSGKQYSIIGSGAPIKAAGGLIIETRDGNSLGNPATFETGRMWLDTTVQGAVPTTGGSTGGTGATVATGPKGDTGAQGIQGIQGIQGPKGDTGAGGGTSGVSKISSNGSLTVSPAGGTGAVVASLNLASANTWTAAQKVNVAAGTSISASGGGIGVSANGYSDGVSATGGVIGVSATGGSIGVTAGGKFYGIKAYGDSKVGSTGLYASGTNFGVEAYGSTYGIVASASGSSGNGVSATGGSSGKGVNANGGTYDFYASGPGQDYGTASSIRWKSNIQLIDNALNKVLNLRGVYYDWDKAHGGGHSMGMIAEEVEKYVPEVVSMDPDAPGYATGMDYGHLTPVLIEAIKEQQKQIEVLKIEIKELKDAINK